MKKVIEVKECNQCVFQRHCGEYCNFNKFIFTDRERMIIQRGAKPVRCKVKKITVEEEK